MILIFQIMLFKRQKRYEGFFYVMTNIIEYAILVRFEV